MLEDGKRLRADVVVGCDGFNSKVRASIGVTAGYAGGWVNTVLMRTMDVFFAFPSVLLAVAMASNIGSVATITGNPQNMMIGSFSGIHYRVFTAALAAVPAAWILLLPFAPGRRLVRRLSV